MSRSEDAGVTIRLMDVAEVQEAFAALGADRDEWRALARELGEVLTQVRQRLCWDDYRGTFEPIQDALAKLREKEERSG